MKLALLPVTCALTLSVGLAMTPGTRVVQDDNSGAEPQNSSELYLKKCASCHGKDGKAKTFKAKFNSARNLADSAWQADVSDERMFNSIMNGKGKMPSFGKKLSESEISSLVAHVRAFKK